MTTDKDWGEVILVVAEIANLHENPEPSQVSCRFSTNTSLTRLKILAFHAVLSHLL